VGNHPGLPGLPDPVPADQAASPDHLNIVSDVVLAGIVTCGFAVFYNTAWRQLWMATSGGMAGHGLRFLAMEAGCRLEAATFLGGLAVGVISAWMARSRKMPVGGLCLCRCRDDDSWIAYLSCPWRRTAAGPAGGNDRSGDGGPDARQCVARVHRGQRTGAGAHPWGASGASTGRGARLPVRVLSRP